MLSESRPRLFLDSSLSRASSGSALSSGFISTSRGCLTGIRNPLLGVPGHHRPGHIDLIPGKPLVAAAVHPVIALQMADNGLYDHSLLEQPFKPGLRLLRTSVFPPTGQRHLGDLGKQGWFLTRFGSNPSISYYCFRKLSQGLLPLHQSRLQQFDIREIGCKLLVGRHIAFAICHQQHLAPILIGPGSLAFTNAHHHLGFK